MRNIQFESQQEREIEYKKIHKTLQKLIVYVDKENRRNYISMAAACALTLISHEQYVANDKGYYEISLRQLEKLKELYEIIYIYIVKGKSKLLHAYSLDINYSLSNNDYTNKELDELRALRDNLTEKNICDKDLFSNNKCGPKK
jgi:hypothetical protein